MDTKIEQEPDPRTSVKLKKRAVDLAAPRSARYDLWDTELRGFGLRVATTGTKTFFVRYRAEGGGRKAPRRFMVVGFGVLTPEQARDKARKILGEVANGGDPALAQQVRRGGMTNSELLDLYEQEGCVYQRGKRCGTPMKDATKRYTLARLQNHVAPLLGRKRISDVRIHDVLKLSADVTSGKTAKKQKLGARSRRIVKGGAGAARKVVRDLLPSSPSPSRAKSPS